MNKKILIPIIVIALVVVIIYVVNSTSSSTGANISSVPSEKTVVTQVSNNGKIPTVSSNSGKIIFSETTYQTPGGDEQIGFNLDVTKDGTITRVDTQIIAKAPQALRYQNRFAQNISAVIVGKKIQDLKNIDRVGGSSLTTEAFNSLLPQLQKQALA